MKNNFLRKCKMTLIYTLRGFILQIILINIVFAYPSSGQDLEDISLTLRLKEVTLEQAFHQMEVKSGFRFFYVKSELPANEKVSIDVINESLSDILKGLSLQFNLVFQRINDQIVVKKGKNIEQKIEYGAVETGTIKGKVVDSRTNEALAGANVLILKGEKLRVVKGGVTDLNGAFYLDNITHGEYNVEVKYVGYRTKTQTLEIQNNKTVVLNVELEESFVDMDEVVVTGSMSQQEKKSMSNPITIISMNNVRELMPAVTNLTDILQYNVPGYFQDVQNEMTVGASLNPVLRGNASASGKQLSIYIDGVPVSNNSYQYQSAYKVIAFSGEPSTTTPQQDINKLINVNDIERIEVLRGPMATTLYGSGAGNGVVNIITKKSTVSRTKYSLSSTLSAVSDMYSNKIPLKNDEDISIIGGTGQIGYNLGASRMVREYTYSPSAIPSYTYWSLNGGSKVNYDPIMVNLNLDYISTQNGAQSISNMWEIYKEQRGWTNFPQQGPANWKLDNHTFNASAVIKNVIADNWYHSVLLGFNSYLQDYYDYTAPSSPDKWNVNNSVMLKNSIRYFMNYNTDVIEDIKMDVTGGFEYWRSSFDYSQYSLTQPYDGHVTTTVMNSNAKKTYMLDENYGYFGEMIWNYDSRLYLSTGYRLEKNSNITANHGLAQAPKIGLSYLQQFGEFVIKPRVSYGSTINPPRWEQVVGYVSASTTVLPNQDLKPERNAGYEIGADIYYSNNFTFEFTYYDQTGTDLIFIQVIPAAPGQPVQQQYQNAGKVYNKGIEIAASANFHPFTVGLTYSYMDNKYGASYQGSQAGSRVLNSPDNLLNLSFSYALPEMLKLNSKLSAVNFQIQYRGTIYTQDLLTYYDGLYKPGAPQVNSSALPYLETGAYAIFNASGNYWLTNFLQFIVDVRNLFDKQIIKGQFYPLVGRLTSLGLKLEF